MSTTSTRSRRLRLGAAAVLTAGLAVTMTNVDHAAGHNWRARAALRDATGRRVGIVRFDGDAAGTEVKITIAGLTEGLDAYHGIHIHAGDGTGRCDGTTTAPFSNVGAHWSAGAEPHGHHDGDLPPILVRADGNGEARAVTGRFEPSELDGKAVILHAGPDNLANIPTRYVNSTTQVAGPDEATIGSGDSGGRVACGVIERG